MLEAAEARPDRAGRLRALGAGAVSARRHRRRGRQPGAHRVRRAVPRLGRRRPRDTSRPSRPGRIPTWSMGPMNTLNSASLVNKGLELIETHLLFGIAYDRIEVVVHPQSIVHSMVTFTDGSTHRPGQPAGHEAADRAGAGLAGTGAGRGRGLRLHAPPPPGSSSRWTTSVFPAVDLARQAGETRWLPDRGLQRRQRRGRCRVPRRSHPIPRDRANHRRRAARCRPVGRRTGYRGRSTRRATLGPRPGARAGAYHEEVCHRPMMFGHRHRAVRAGHLGVGGAARVRPHVGGARHRDEGAPLLRRLRADPVVHPAAQQAGLHRVRRQGRPAGRLLRHRGHDLGRGDRTRRRALRDVQAEDVEAGRRAVRRPGHELHHRPGAHLRDRPHLGAAQPAPAHRRGRRRNRRASHSDSSPTARSDECHGAGPAALGRHQARRHGRQGRRHAGRQLRRRWPTRSASSTVPPRSSCSANGHGRSPPSST